MGIDKETIPNFLNIVFEANPALITKMKKQAELDDQNQLENKFKSMSITDDLGALEVEEYYFSDDECNKGITFNGRIKTPDGDIELYFSIPLSDILLMDILTYANKRFNKLKTVIEALK